jgi:hypothetical protein
VSKTTACKFAALLAITPLAIAGCSSSGGGAKTSSPPATTPPASQPASSPPASTPGGGETVTKAQADAMLLSLQDVGSGFTKAQFQPSNDPLPCAPNDPPLEQQIPSTLEAGTAFIRNGAAFGEDLRFYPDSSTAQNVLDRAAHGLDCPSGKLNLTGRPETVSFGKLQDVTSAIHGADKAVAVTGHNARYDIVLIGCQIGREAVLFSFLRTASTPTSSLPNPVSIVNTAVQKIKNS